MLEMKRGCTVPQNKLLQEQYEWDGKVMVANVDASRILRVMQQFIAMQDEALFFFLEIPATRQQEEALQSGESNALHKAVYYLDGVSAAQAEQLLAQYGELLVQDGYCEFGFGNRSGTAEIQSCRYNIVTLLTEDARYCRLFETLGIARAQRIVTAWDAFSSDTPGSCTAAEVAGVRIFDLPRLLQPMGLYFAEYRED